METPTLMMTTRMPSDRITITIPSDGDPRSYRDDLRSRLAQYKILAAELAREADMTKSSLSRFFNSDETNPTLETVARLEQALARILNRRAADAAAELKRKRLK